MIKYRTNWITPNTLTMDGDDEHSKLVDALEENGPAIKRAAATNENI
jgi:hypothetical protein